MTLLREHPAFLVRIAQRPCASKVTPTGGSLVRKSAVLLPARLIVCMVCMCLHSYDKDEQAANQNLSRNFNFSTLLATVAVEGQAYTY